MAHDIAQVAATVALSGEIEAARTLFARAIDLSKQNDPPKFNHPWIAKMQVHGGLLLDAYQTLHNVDDPDDRIPTLADLARAAAKREFQASRSQANTLTPGPS